MGNDTSPDALRFMEIPDILYLVCAITVNLCHTQTVVFSLLLKVLV